MGSWEDLREEQHLTPFQALVVAICKLVGWHYLQVGWFISAYLAYKDIMTFWQTAFAIVVVTKEINYGVILLLGVFSVPHFLLFCPLSDHDRNTRIAYFLNPTVSLPIPSFANLTI